MSEPIVSISRGNETDEQWAILSQIFDAFFTGDPGELRNKPRFRPERQVKMAKSYRPQEKTRAILDAAWAFVQAVPYKVTARWLFYQLLQSGYYSEKESYDTFLQMLSRARHKEYDGWRPDTIVDDRREAIIRAGGYENVSAWVKHMSEGGWLCDLDHFYKQSNYIEIWYEAEAMSGQFKYHTRGINLRPFAGDPSIDYKYTIAKDLEKMKKLYEKSIIILYFGDYDKKGLSILENALAHIRKWCKYGFEVDRCGLNEGDGQRLGIPENPDKPGTYQWVALSDELAKDLITSSVRKYIDTTLIDQTINEGNKAAELFDKFVSGFKDYFEARATE